MSQDSAFWDDGVGGDDASLTVWTSPYADTDYADVYSKIIASDTNEGFVIPGYENNLVVTENAPADMNVLVDTGAAFVRGFLYENTTQETVAIAAADALQPRIDRVVLRITFAAQTIRLAVITGTPAATPSLPALTQTAVTYEVDLAHVWVPAATVSISDEDIDDRRLFASNYFGIWETMFNDNLIINNEFLAYSALGGGAAPTDPPDYWELVNTPTMASVAKPTEMMRGRGVQITADAAGEGLSQTILVLASTMYAIKYLLYVTAGDTATVEVTTDSAAPGTITRTVRRTGAWLTGYVYYITEADATELTVSFEANANTDVIRLGQVIVVQGYLPGEFRPFHETLPFQYRNIQDTDWDGDLKAVGNYTIDLSADYSAAILTGTKGLILTVGVTEIGSVGATVYIGSRTPVGFANSTIATTSVVSNVTVWLQGKIECLTRNFYVTVGGAQMDEVYIFICGVIT